MVLNVTQLVQQAKAAETTAKGLPEGPAMAKVLVRKTSANSFVQNNGRSILGSLLEGKGLYREEADVSALKNLGFNAEFFKNPDTTLTYGLHAELKPIEVVPVGLTINFDNEFPVRVKGHTEPVFLEELLEEISEALQTRALILDLRVHRVMLDKRQLTIHGTDDQDFGRFNDILVDGVYYAPQPSIATGQTDEEYAAQVLYNSSLSRQRQIGRRSAVRPMGLGALIEARGQDAPGRAPNASTSRPMSAANILEQRRASTAATAGQTVTRQQPTSPTGDADAPQLPAM